ncbi:alpha/beta hydrolase [Hansschlegelia sp. KR7-227]|uniref:alpha/beta hydrolase n=1 Tax=Hansschlegelia sp. KR7-227 TaxID=3400914 RepID=UPI003C03F9F3
MLVVVRAWIACGAIILGGCATRVEPTLTVVAAAPYARLIPVFVATTRAPDARSPAMFTTGRAREVSYARYVVSVPPGHKAGEIETSQTARPDPAKSFAIVDATRLDETSFYRQVLKAKEAGKPISRLGVFVHGYNYTFEESLFRRAQLAVDSHFGGPAFVFAWPSAASPTAYAADRDASTLSRDGLAKTLERLTDDPALRVSVFSHSLGSGLTMEALRDLRLTGRGRTVDRLEQVILAAPDIDVDLFVEQLETVGQLKSPLVVLTSKDDGALSFSSALAGGRLRVGNTDVEDPKVQSGARHFDVSVIDISQLNKADGVGHDRYAAMAALYPKLRSQLDARSSLASKAGAFVFNLARDEIRPIASAR